MIEISKIHTENICGGSLPGQDTNKNSNDSNSSGKDWNQCKSDILAAAGIGAVAGATATGPYGALGAAVGTLVGGAYAAANSPSCTGGKSKDTVMCTHFHQKGMLTHQLWRISSLHANRKMHPATFRGYQVYGIPYVKLMRRSRLAEKLAFPLLLWRTEEVAYQMGLRKKGNWKGKLVRALTEPVWFITGLMVKEQDWESLWRENSAAV